MVLLELIAFFLSNLLLGIAYKEYLSRFTLLTGRMVEIEVVSLVEATWLL